MFFGSLAQGRVFANTCLQCWMCLDSWCFQNKMYFRHIRKMNVIFVTWYFEMLSDVADSEFAALDTIPWTACCPKDPGLGVILTPGGPRQGWSEEDEEGQIFWDAKKWMCWYESIVLGAWISPPPKNTDTWDDEYWRGWCSCFVSKLLRNFNSMPLMMLRWLSHFSIPDGIFQDWWTHKLLVEHLFGQSGIW